MSQNPADLLLAEIPSPPEQAAQFAADRLGANSWDACTKAPDAEGGRPTRWLDLPATEADMVRMWGPGVYRLAWRTSGRRSLGTSPPFQVGGLPVPQQSHQPPPQAAQPPAPPQPVNGKDAALQALVSQLAGALEQQRSRPVQRQPNPPPNLDPITAWDVMEQRAHERHRELSEMQQQGWAMLAQLYQQAADNAIRVATDHRDRVDALYQEKSSELRAQRERQEQREAELRGQLDTLRGEFVEQLAELQAEPGEAIPTPEGFKEKLQAILGMLTTPEGQQVAGIIQDAIKAVVASKTGAEVGASPQLPEGGSLGG